MSRFNKSKRTPRITVDVTQEIINTSAQRDSSHCMIADAVKAVVPEAKFVSVDLATIRFTDLTAGCRYVYLTPRHAQAALLDFDQGKKPEPFTVRLQGAHVLPTGNARKARAELQSHPSGETTSNPPTRVGGRTPPIGPLASGATISPEDKQRAVAEALRSDPTGSNKQIARTADVHPTTVAKYRKRSKGLAAAKTAAEGSTATGRRREFGLRAIIR